MEENKIKNKNFNYLDRLKFIDSQSTILDFGANIGDITDLLYKKYKSYIYSYEPNIVCYNYMKKRFANINKIKIFNYAVSNYTGNDFLYFHKNAKGNHDKKFIEGASLRTDKDNVDIKKKIRIKVINIKEVLKKHNVIDLIKIDIEGSEYQIMSEIIKNKKKIKKVICELHGNPSGKKINNVSKNRKFMNEYHALISNLKKNKLYDNWFYEWH